MARRDRWMDPLNADPLPWLLEESSPAVRAATLVRLLRRPADDPEVIEADVLQVLEVLTELGRGADPRLAPVGGVDLTQPLSLEGEVTLTQPLSLEGEGYDEDRALGPVFRRDGRI